MGDKDKATHKASIASHLPTLSYIGSNQRDPFCADPEGLSPPAQCLIRPSHPVSAPCIEEKQTGTKKRGIFRAFSFTLHRRRYSFGQWSRDSGNHNERRSLHDSSESSKGFPSNGTHSYDGNKTWNSKTPQKQHRIVSGSTRGSSLKRDSLLALGPFWGCLQQSRSEDNNDDDVLKSLPNFKVTETQIAHNVSDGSCETSSCNVSSEGRLGPVTKILNCKASMENVCEVWSLKSRSSGDYENVIAVPQTHHQDENEPLVQNDGANVVEDLDTMAGTASKTNRLHLVANGNESNQPCKHKVADIVEHAAVQEMFSVEDVDTVTETPEVDLETVSFSDIEKDIGFPSLALQQSDCDMQGSVDALPSIPESPESSRSTDSALMEDFVHGENGKPEGGAERDTLVWNAIVLPQGQEKYTKLTSVPSSLVKLESCPDEVLLDADESSWATCHLEVSDDKDMAATVELPTSESGMDCSEQIGGTGTKVVAKWLQFGNADPGEQEGRDQKQVNANIQACSDEVKQKEEDVKRIRAASVASSSGVNSMDFLLRMGSLELDEDDLMLTVDMSEACKPSSTHVLKGAQSGFAEAEYCGASSEDRKEETTVCFVPAATGILNEEKQASPRRISTCRVQTGAVLRNSNICETGRRTGGISPAVSRRTSPRNFCDVAWASEEVLGSSEPTLLRQASAECTGLKTLLLRLRRLLQEEADANLSFPTLPNSDGAATINQALLLGEISRLNERVREQDKIICKMQQQLDERGLQGTFPGCNGRVERACQTDDATSSKPPPLRRSLLPVRTVRAMRTDKANLPIPGPSMAFQPGMQRAGLGLYGHIAIRGPQ
uniref:serine-rich coiled-coil domain-containing protein 1-like isoform X3 n=1 Tax=Myxine glutinosa TaxID=7769 RepID=UPI00358E6580